MELKARALQLEEELIQVKLSRGPRCRSLAPAWESPGLSGLRSYLWTVDGCSPPTLVGLLLLFLKWVNLFLGLWLCLLVWAPALPYVCEAPAICVPEPCPCSCASTPWTWHLRHELGLGLWRPRMDGSSRWSEM